jgi:hypothetical protein
MSNPPHSPLSNRDLDLLEVLAAKSVAQIQAEGLTPLYVALDVGDQSQRNAWLFLSWPALNSRSSHCARLIFDYIGDLAKTEFGAVMVATSPQDQADGPHR